MSSYLRPSRDRLPELAVGLVILLVILLSYGVYRDCKAQKACETRGGIVVETNCRLVTNCHHDGYGHTTCTTQNACDWRCDMRNAPAEAEEN